MYIHVCVGIQKIEFVNLFSTHIWVAQRDSCSYLGLKFRPLIGHILCWIKFIYLAKILSLRSKILMCGFHHDIFVLQISVSWYSRVLYNTFLVGRCYLVLRLYCNGQSHQWLHQILRVG